MCDINAVMSKWLMGKMIIIDTVVTRQVDLSYMGSKKRSGYNDLCTCIILFHSPKKYLQSPQQFICY